MLRRIQTFTPKPVWALLIAVVSGAIVGWLLGPASEPLGEIGLYFIRLLKVLATPLLFFGVVDTFCKTEITARDGARLFSFSTLNGIVALIISFVFTRLLPLERWVHFDQIKLLMPTLGGIAAFPAGRPSQAISTIQILNGFVPTNVLQPFIDNNIISVVGLAILIGIAMRRSETPALEKLVYEAFVLITKILGWFVKAVPIAVFCVIAKATGAGGFSWFQTLAVFVGVVLAGLLLQVFVYYPLLLRAFKLSPIRFFKMGSEALLTAMSTGSSLATLPVTLDNLQNKMKVSARYSRLSAAVGTNLNHVGILLYEAVAAVFIARLFGIELTLTRQLAIAGTAIIASIGIAGVPEAGLITLSLVLGAAGLPVEAIPLFLPFDWLIGRFRATANVASDMAVANLLAADEPDLQTRI